MAAAKTPRHRPRVKARALPRAAALALLITVPLAGARSADAHEVDPTVQTVLDEVVPSVEGLVVQVGVSVTTQLLVENRTDEVLEILDDDGQPFLRIGPSGVEADLASPTWARSNSPGGSIPAGMRAGTPDRWALVAAEPAWGWFDHRLHPAAVLGLEEGSEPRWEVPMRLGTRDVVARGHLERRAVLGTFSSVLDGTPEPFDGVVVQILDGRAPGVFLRNSSAEPVVVVGADGEPFARIGPEGAEVNRRSPMWFHTSQASDAPVDGLAPDPAAPPDWVSLGPSPSLAWLDDRGRWPDDAPPADALASTDPTVVLEWSVPLEQGDRRAEMHAVTTWVPDSAAAAAASAADANGGGEGLPLWLVLAAPVGALVVVGAIRAARSGPRTT